MTLIVETGAGLSTAESYASVAEADTYHSSAGQGDAWGDIDDKEVALRLATNYMGQKYRTRWAGVRRSASQALDWPRYDVRMIDGPGSGSGSYGTFPNYYPFDTVPIEVKRACMELALKTAAGSLLTDTDRLTSSERVGPLAVSYFEGQSPQKKYAAIDGILSVFFGGMGPYSIRLVRA